MITLPEARGEQQIHDLCWRELVKKIRPSNDEGREWLNAMAGVVARERLMTPERRDQIRAALAKGSMLSPAIHAQAVSDVMVALNKMSAAALRTLVGPPESDAMSQAMALADVHSSDPDDARNGALATLTREAGDLARLSELASIAVGLGKLKSIDADTARSIAASGGHAAPMDFLGKLRERVMAAVAAFPVDVLRDLCTEKIIEEAPQPMQFSANDSDSGSSQAGHRCQCRGKVCTCKSTPVVGTCNGRSCTINDVTPFVPVRQ